MKKQLQFAGIQKVQTYLDYTQQEISTVTLQFVIVGDDLDEAQRELVEVLQNAVEQHCKLPKANFEHYNKMMEGLKCWKWKWSE